MNKWIYVVFSIMAVIIQYWLDRFELVPYGVVLIYALTPILAASTPEYINGANANWPYRYDGYIMNYKNIFLRNACYLFLLAILLNTWIAQIVAIALQRNFQMLTLNAFPWIGEVPDVFTKNWLWMSIHGICTALVVMISYHTIIDITGTIFKWKNFSWIVCVSVIFSLFCLTPFGSLGYLVRELSNNSQEIKINTVATLLLTIPTEEIAPTEVIIPTVVTSPVEVKITKEAIKHSKARKHARGFLYDNLIINTGSAILSAVIVHCFLLTLKAGTRNLILGHLEKLVASIALLHISSGFVTSVGHLTNDYKLLVLILPFVQFYLLYLATFRIFFYLINVTPYQLSILLDKESILVKYNASKGV